MPGILRPDIKKKGRVTTAEDLIPRLVVAIIIIIIIEKTRQ